MTDTNEHMSQKPWEYPEGFAEEFEGATGMSSISTREANWRVGGKYSAKRSGSKEIVDQYRRSIKMDQYAPGHKEHSITQLYTKPVIIQKTKNGGFQNIDVDELFKPETPLNKLVILQGNTGSGKSFIAQKIMLDWATETGYHNYDLVFCIKCEELMCISEEMNLFELLSWSCNSPSMKISKMLMSSPCSVLFIIDGFDELRLMRHDINMLDPFKKAQPEVIVCALLKGQNLPKSTLPRYTLLITTRSEVPLGTLSQRSQCFLNITGFSEKKIKQYFQKFFQDEKLFRKAYESIKSNETLFTACSSPVICWIICTSIRERFNDGSDVISGLESTTSIYVNFLSTFLEHQCQGVNESGPTLLKSLGQLAERGILEQQVLFDERTINETLQYPVYNLFLDKFLQEKIIQQKKMFRFVHLSFQDFFTALFYVLLDEDESQKKVRDLLQTVERGWAFRSWSVTEFSLADSEVRRSKQLHSVVLFLCGLCKNESINSFFEKHNVTVPVNIESQLKEWIHQCSLRYQHENMLFLLHCLYELHDKSFIGKVLEGLILIDLSNTKLTRTDCCVLRFCLQCCKHIKNLRLNVTSDDLKILHPELSCEELWLIVDTFSNEVGDFILALGKGNIQKQLIIKVDAKKSKSYSEVIVSAKDQDLTLSVSCSQSNRKSSLLLLQITLTCSRSETQILQKLQNLPSFGGLEKEERTTLLEVLQSVSGLKKVHLQIESWTEEWVSTILSITQTCPYMQELRINAFITLTLEESLMTSLKLTGWTLTVCRMSVLIQRSKKSFTLTGLRAGKTPKESSDSVLCVPSQAVLSSTSQSFLEKVEVFTPDYIERDNENKETNKHRFVSPHAGQFQCSLTNLVFVMKDEGEVLYKIVSWDQRCLDGLGQMQPAGPLYNIDCFKGSISQLQLPHCEILSETKNTLAVARFTDGNVEILQPLKVTETHVIIDITKLSMFGLLNTLFFNYSIRAQMLLFLRPKTVARKQKILNVHLLPGNVPLSEVRSKHQEKSYIETTSTCHLISGRKYGLCCHHEEVECEVQPQEDVFEHNFGPNFHPTFQVFLDVNIEEVQLCLLETTDKMKEVWKKRRVLLSGQEVEPAVDRRFTVGCEFVDKHRSTLIQNVVTVMEIADSLSNSTMISKEMYTEVQRAKTNQEKMRLLFSVLDSSKTKKEEFYRLLKEKEPHLINDLNLI